MLIKPQKEDFKIISYYLGEISGGLAITMFLPLIAAFCYQEWVPALDFISGAGVALIVGCLLTINRPKRTDLSWSNGIVIAGLSWLLAMVLAAVPLYLSGHFGSFLDSLFETMSGFATTGLSLTRDVDHMAQSYNLWRHFTQFLGGQGIVVIALTFFVAKTSGVFSLYVGEARDEKILPNVVSTARFIWLVTFTYLFLGVASLTIIGLQLGLSTMRSFFHGLCIFMAGWATGGFSPQGQSILYYHSIYYEIATFFIFFSGSINFGLHYLIWSGRRRELWRDIEIRTYLFTAAITVFLTLVGLTQLDLFPNMSSVFRIGFYQVLSGHTGTGFMTVTANQFSQWNDLALLGVIMAMGFGGCACSTAGAIKTLRIGVVAKGLWRQVKTVFTPEQGMVIEKVHHFRDTVLEDKQVQAAGLVVIAYLSIYLLGAVMGILCGYPFLPALFESVSAAANVGHTIGITSPAMPALLKITYILEMWVGRFEFLATFVIFGFIASLFKGK
ncbi:MAG: TrkH family potassium uptake protein [Candidatus Omnitrophota bacterium]